jgi:hypothetical protein
MDVQIYFAIHAMFKTQPIAYNALLSILLIRELVSNALQHVSNALSSLKTVKHVMTDTF